MFSHNIYLISTRVDITVCQHEKCFIFFKCIVIYICMYIVSVSANYQGTN